MKNRKFLPLLCMIPVISFGTPGAAESVTTAFADDLPNQVLLYETDFNDSTGWAFGSHTYMFDGALASTRDDGWAGSWLIFDQESVLDGPLNLEVDEETTTVLYFSERFGGDTGDNRTVFRFQGLGDGDFPYLGVRVGVEDSGTTLGISDNGNLFGETDYRTGMSGVTTSTEEPLDYRLVLHVVAETGTLTVSFEQYDAEGEAWETVESIEIADYSADSRLGSNLVDRISVLFRTSGERVTGMAITQSAPPPPPTFAGWQERHFTTEELDDEAVSGPFADPDGDGMPNLLKYALGGNPWTASKEIAPRMGLAGAAGDQYLALSFIPADPAPLDLDYRVEVSSDLINWTEEVRELAFLLDEFVVGDGTGISYQTGDINGQSGGANWAPDTEWSLGGSGGNRRHISVGDYIQFEKFNVDHENNQIILSREYASPGIDRYDIHFRVAFGELGGIRLLEGEPTSSGGNRASDKFAIFDGGGTSNAVTTGVPWYIEAAGGYWHALPGTGNGGNYGEPVQLAPLVEDETYEISVSLFGDASWEATVSMVNAEESFSSGRLPFIGDNEQVHNWLHIRSQYSDTAGSDYNIRLHSASITSPFELAEGEDAGRASIFRDTVSSGEEGRRFMRLRVTLDEE